MTPKYILTKSLCREPYCASEPTWRRTAENLISDMTYTTEYVEPGYESPSTGVILFSNWNYFPRKAVDLLEQAGYACEWEDEWSMCDCCYKAFRTSPDSYDWKPSYIVANGECICVECLSEDSIECLENNPEMALSVDGVNPADYGYHLIQDDFENGWYPGQNDNPKAIFASLRNTYDRILFVIDRTGQFDIGFSVWYKYVD